MEKRIPLLPAAVLLLGLLAISGISNAFPDRTTRIVGGSEVPDTRYPWMASIYFRLDNSGSFVPRCGGSLIASRWVLSAAHCFVDSNSGTVAQSADVAVLLGKSDLADGGGLSLVTANIHVHPGYDSSDGSNDIALLHLPRTVDFDPILISRAQNPVPQVGELAVVSGWGRTEEDGARSAKLLEVALPVVGTTSCLPFYPDLYDEERMVCAGGSGSGGRDSCQGDSGGPLFVRRGNDFVQAGIVSFGMGCARPGIPGVYTRLSTYFDWIDSVAHGTRVYDGGDENSVMAVPELIEFLPANSDTRGSLLRGQAETFQVSGVDRITVETLSGDADLYVYSSRPFSADNVICRSLLVEAFDQCQISVTGNFFVSVNGYENSSYRLTVRNGDSRVTQFARPALQPEVPVTGSLAAQTSALVVADAGKSAVLTSLTGDADLLVFSNDSYTRDALVCLSSLPSQLDSCDIQRFGGRVYIAVYANTAVDFSLRATDEMVNTGPNLVLQAQTGSSGGSGVFHPLAVVLVLLLSGYCGLRKS